MIRRTRGDSEERDEQDETQKRVPENHDVEVPRKRNRTEREAWHGMEPAATAQEAKEPPVSQRVVEACQFMEDAELPRWG